MMKTLKVTPVEVVRNNGYFMHPNIQSLFNEREALSFAEFHHWLEFRGLEHYQIGDDRDYDLLGYQNAIETFSPERPDGEGWFVGMISEDDDGPFCTWLRSSSEVIIYDDNFVKKVSSLSIVSALTERSQTYADGIFCGKQNKVTAVDDLFH
ncbi:hypothetical protein [Dickeya phage Sucellus]|nr:hypothetical protein [Dickeya phage Sucellus]